MTTATHWNYNLAIGDGLDEGWPMEDPIAAARAYLAIWEAPGIYDIRDLIFIKDAAHVILHGMTNDPSGPTESEREGDYAATFWTPGSTWYRQTGETRTVGVSLAFKLVEAT